MSESTVDDATIALNLAILEPGRISFSFFADLLNTNDMSRLLVLDLRSFLNYNQSHVRDSLNVHVPTNMMKKKGFSLGMVEKGICRQADKDRFKNRAGVNVVLYDQSEDSSIPNYLLVNIYRCLKEENIANSVYWLEGGFEQFAKAYPQYCKLCTPIMSKLFSCADNNSHNSVSKSLNTQSCSGPDEPVQILGFLFLAGEKVACSRSVLNKHEIKYILNTAVECESPFANEFNYLRLELMDTPNQKNLFAVFETAFAFINKARDNNQRVLVHCRAGQSRSATIVLAYLMKTLEWDLARAYSYVQRRRPAISPNLGFMGQLTTYDTQLQQTRPSYKKKTTSFMTLPPRPSSMLLPSTQLRSNSSTPTASTPVSAKELNASVASSLFSMTMEDVPKAVSNARTSSHDVSKETHMHANMTSPPALANLENPFFVRRDGQHRSSTSTESLDSKRDSSDMFLRPPLGLNATKAVDMPTTLVS